MDTLITELQRLYLLKGQQYHDQSKDGESYFPAGALTPALLSQHLKGEKTVALNLVNAEGLTRCMVLDFDGVAHGHGSEHWAALCKVANGLQADLGLPAPAVSISGRKGWGLWLSLADPVPVGQAQQFLHLLRKKYLADLPKGEIDLRPDTNKPTSAAQAVAKLPPCLHRASGKWASFITPEGGEAFIAEPWLDVPPAMDKQAALLADVQSLTTLQFMQALTKLQQELGANEPKNGDGPALAPDYAKSEKGYLPPCITALRDKGVPHAMQYNTANLNLKAFTASAGLSDWEAHALAEVMALASEDHPTTKNGAAKVKNFESNQPRTFYCEYARNTPVWAALYGGVSACAKCAINPGIPSDKQTSQTQNSSSTSALEAAVALDLLAYHWKRKEGLPQIRYVWPVVLVGETERASSAPWYKLAAEAIEKGATSAAYFSLVGKHIAERRIDVSLHLIWQNSAGAFYEKLQAHAVTEEQGKAALERGLHLERRLTLTSAVRQALEQGPEIAANVVAMKLRGAAEDALRAESGAGPLAGLRNDLFKDLARAVSEVVPTPYARLNGLLHGGFRGSRLYVLIAPPKAGKTTFMGACMDHAAANGYPTLYVGYEMSRGQMVEYALARRLGINSKRIETRDLSEHEAELIAANLDGYLAKEGQFLEVWEAGLTTSIADMAAWATKAKTLHPDKTPLIVIDYLQLAYTGIPEIDRHPSETKRVSEVAVACKHLARQTGAAVVALSSVTKSAETDSRNSGEIDVTAARDSLAIIHAADGVMALQTATVRTSEGKGENKVETELDPWAFIANQMRVQGREQEAVMLERALQKADKEGYPQGGMGYAIRARLSLLRHRGSTGDVALYYRRAYHQLEEVALPGMEAIEQTGHKAEISINVFQKYVETKAPEMEQQTFAGFEPSAADTATAAPTPLPEVSFRYITDKDAALAAIGKLEGLVGIDLETSGLSPLTAQARLLQLADSTGEALVIDLWKAGGLQAYKEALQGLHLVAHNAVFEMGFLWHLGIEVTPECTMLAAHVLTGKREGLKVLAQRYLGLDMSKEQQVSDWTADPLTEAQLRYAALDAIAVQQVFSKVIAEVEERDSLKAYTLTRDAQPSIVRMELAGIPFNAVRQQGLIKSLTETRDKLLAQIGEALGNINPSSGAQLTAWIVEQLGGVESEKYKAWPKTPSGKQLKTGADDLRKGLVYLPEAAATLIKDVLLPLKDAEKMLSAFGQGLADKINPTTHRIHADFALAGAATGRMACSNPNLQQMPRDKEFRGLFEAPAGRVFVICDYSQMELRVAAEIAQEQALIEAYRQGKDTHRLTAAMLLNKAPEDVTKQERQLAKAVNFGLLFGQGAKGLQAYAASSYGVEITEEQARKYRDAWFAAYPAFKTWHQKSGRAAEKALAVRTPAGRERRWESLKDFAVTAAFNTPVQGGAAEAMLASLGHLEKNLKGLDAVPVAVVHDEVIVEAAADQAEQVKAILEQSMIAGFKDVFPEAPLVDVVEASIGASWADK